MPKDKANEAIRAGRLPASVLETAFADLHPALKEHEAAVAADRCYFCHDAPCTTACPTEIDIPLFIRQIATGTPVAAAKTILTQNILGGMCARVCPTETLCEEACVRMTAEERPVEIGRLQRFATDRIMERKDHPFSRAPSTGKRVAVVGAGPAGLACAHRLAMHGHDVDLYDAHDKPGGLNEFGIAAYKATNNIAQDEAAWLMQIGGISLHSGKRLGDGIDLGALRKSHDAVFLGIGLAGVNALDLGKGAGPVVEDAVDFIERLRQSADKTDIPVGDRVVVVGGGMTAVDAAVQAKLLGASSVTIAYRRSREAMKASAYEQELALSKGVHLEFNMTPKGLSADGLDCLCTAEKNGGLQGTGVAVTLPADHVLVAIGQRLDGVPDAVDVEGGKIAVTGSGRTSVEGVWAGGDCASGGDDLTVTAVAEGRDAAEDIHNAIS